jgi:hypothetical protein
VFDTLFGTDAQYKAQPQMVERFGADADGKRWQLGQRDDLAFHDGSKVPARDCVASTKRWGARDSFGRSIRAAGTSITRRGAAPTSSIRSATCSCAQRQGGDGRLADRASARGPARRMARRPRPRGPAGDRREAAAPGVDGNPVFWNVKRS